MDNEPGQSKEICVIMRSSNRIISSIILTAFLINATVADCAFALAPGSGIDDISGAQQNRRLKAELAMERILMDVSAGSDHIDEAVLMQYEERFSLRRTSVFRPASAGVTVDFKSMNPVPAIPGRFCARLTVDDSHGKEDFWALFGLSKSGKTFPVDAVYSDEEFNRLALLKKAPDEPGESQFLIEAEAAMALGGPNPGDMSDVMTDAIGEGLAADDMPLKMLPSFAGIRTGKEKGDYFFIDLGGTKLRVGGIRLNGKGGYEDLGKLLVSEIPEDLKKNGDAVSLFDYIAAAIDTYISNNSLSRSSSMKFGFTWSFPAKNTAIDAGIHLEWTKGWNVSDVVGKDPVKLLREALDRRKLNNVKIKALCNDTVGTAMFGNIGIILGTGTNAAFPLCIADAPKLGMAGSRETMIFNSEWGNYGLVPSSSWDIILDTNSANPGRQKFEKMISGMYMGEIARLILKEAIEKKELFGGRGSPAIMDRPSEMGKTGFTAEKHMSPIELDDMKADPHLPGVQKALEGLGITWSTAKDRRFVKMVCGFVSERAAMLAATGIASVVKKVKKSVKLDKYVVAIDGSIYAHYPRFEENVRRYIFEALGTQADDAELIMAQDGSGVGAAMIAAVADNAAAQAPAAPVPEKKFTGFAPDYYTGGDRYRPFTEPARVGPVDRDAADLLADGLSLEGLTRLIRLYGMHYRNKGADSGAIKDEITRYHALRTAVTKVLSRVGQNTGIDKTDGLPNIDEIGGEAVLEEARRIKTSTDGGKRKRNPRYFFGPGPGSALLAGLLSLAAARQAATAQLPASGDQPAQPAAAAAAARDESASATNRSVAFSHKGSAYHRMAGPDYDMYGMPIINPFDGKPKRRGRPRSKADGKAAREPYEGPTPLEELISNERLDAIREVFNEALAEIPERWVSILRLRAQGLSLKNIAGRPEFNISREKVRQLQAKAEKALWWKVENKLNKMRIDDIGPGVFPALKRYPWASIMVLRYFLSNEESPASSPPDTAVTRDFRMDTHSDGDAGNFAHMPPKPAMNDAVSEYVQYAYTVKTKAAGDMQIGSPSELIKFFMRNKRPVPSTLVAPRSFLINGINYGDMEFFCYFNYFVNKGRKVRVIATAEQAKRICAILRETLFGPDAGQMISAGMSAAEAGALIKELNHFRKKPDGSQMMAEDFIEFVVFDEDGIANIDGIKVRSSDKGFTIEEEGVVIADIPHISDGLTAPEALTFPDKPFTAPEFGVTFIGSSTGFDPAGLTTSFISWWNGKGMLVDPLVYSVNHMRSLGIDPSDVTDVFLSHVHGDHDAGALEMILSGRKINLITSRVVFESFLRKAEAITGQSLRDMMNFVEVKPGVPFSYRGAKFEFSYGLHSIPCLRFRASYKGKSVSYSGDTRFEPAFFDDLESQGIIDGPRKEDLLNLIFSSDVVIHEAGGLPLHTQIPVLAGQPDKLKRKLYIVHSPKVDPATGLRRPAKGDSIDLMADETFTIPQDEDILALRTVAFLEELDLREVLVLTRKATPVEYDRGHVILKQGDVGDNFYVVSSGEVEVTVTGADGQAVDRVMLGKGSPFGEQALINGVGTRNATVTALTHVRLLVFSKKQFNEMLGGQGVAGRIEKVSANRPVLSKVLPFVKLPPRGMIEACIMAEPAVFPNGAYVIKQGSPGDSMFVIKSGTVDIIDETTGGVIASKGPGDVIGEIALLRDIPRTASVRVTSDKLETLVITRNDFKVLIDRYPYMRYYLEQLSDERMTRSVRAKTTPGATKYAELADPEKARLLAMLREAAKDTTIPADFANPDECSVRRVGQARGVATYEAYDAIKASVVFTVEAGHVTSFKAGASGGIRGQEQYRIVSSSSSLFKFIAMNFTPDSEFTASGLLDAGFKPSDVRRADAIAKIRRYLYEAQGSLLKDALIERVPSSRGARSEVIFRVSENGRQWAQRMAPHVQWVRQEKAWVDSDAVIGGEFSAPDDKELAVLAASVAPEGAGYYLPEGVFSDEEIAEMRKSVEAVLKGKLHTFDSVNKLAQFLRSDAASGRAVVDLCGVKLQQDELAKLFADAPAASKARFLNSEVPGTGALANGERARFAKRLLLRMGAVRSLDKNDIDEANGRYRLVRYMLNPYLPQDVAVEDYMRRIVSAAQLEPSALLSNLIYIIKACLAYRPMELYDMRGIDHVTEVLWSA
jgi:hexokinase